MTTVYIKKTKSIGFKEDSLYKNKIRKALLKSNLVEGDHFIEGSNPQHTTALYWKTSRITLRDFKKAIGAKLIFEHRLEFYENVQDLVPGQDNKLSPEEEKMLSEIVTYGIKRRR